jgi:C-terminal processing protease CtpA/Prc
VLRTVRRGLRRTQAPRDQIIGWVGGRSIWNASPQDPDAIEILYHAADFRGKAADAYGTRYNAVYYGLSVVQPKTPAVLQTLVEMSLAEKCDWGRVAWGARAQRDETLAYLKPFLDAEDEATREKAAVLAKVLGGAPDANEAVMAWTRKTIRAKFGDRLPAIRQALASGRPRERIEALDLALRERIFLIMDDSFVDAFGACAADKDPAVRKEVARSLGQSLFWFGGARKGEAIGVLLKLSEDPDPRVRYDAVYHGLSRLPQERREDVVRRLLDMAMFDRQPGLFQQDLRRRIAWGLGQDHDLAARLLNDDLRGADPARAEAARAVYKEMTGQTAPGLGKSDPEARKGYFNAFRDLYEHLGKVYPNFALKGIDWDKVGKELRPRADAVETEEQFGLLIEELVARLEDSHASVHEGSATPPSPELPEWDPWVACLIDDRGRPVIYTVRPATPAWKAGVRPGMTVVSVNGIPAAEAMDRWMRRQRTYVGYSSERSLRYDAARMFHRQREKGAKVALVLEDVDGRETTVELTAEGRGWYLPRLPVPREGIEDGGADVQGVRLKDGIGYIHVRRIRPGLEVALDQALTALGDVKGLILDVRGNSGGGFDPKTAFRNFDPSPGETAGPPRPHYNGPIALLIDERCISAGEGWASWFVAKKRAKSFGTATAGASARKETYTLSNGMYRVEVPVKAYTGFLDRPIERRGLEPDVEVRCTARDLSRGRDTVVETAAAWLAQAGRDD